MEEKGGWSENLLYLFLHYYSKIMGKIIKNYLNYIIPPFAWYLGIKIKKFLIIQVFCM